jgi:hypothetical protein
MLSVHDGTVVRDPGARIAPPEPIDLTATSRAFEVPRVDPEPARPDPEPIITALTVEHIGQQIQDRHYLSSIDREGAPLLSANFKLRHPSITGKDFPEVLMQAISDRMAQGTRYALTELEAARQGFGTDPVCQKWQRLEARLREAQAKEAKSREDAEESLREAHAAMIADSNPDPAERRARKARGEQEIQANRADALRKLAGDARNECEQMMLGKLQERLHALRAEASAKAGQAKRQIADLLGKSLNEILFWDGVLSGTQGTRGLGSLGAFLDDPRVELPGSLSQELPAPDVNQAA